MVSCNTTLEEQTSMFADSTRLWDTVTHTQYYSHRGPSVLKGHLPPCRSRRLSSLRPHIGRRSLLSGLQTCDALFEAMGAETVHTPSLRQSHY